MAGTATRSCLASTWQRPSMYTECPKYVFPAEISVNYEGRIVVQSIFRTGRDYHSLDACNFAKIRHDRRSRPPCNFEIIGVIIGRFQTGPLDTRPLLLSEGRTKLDSDRLDR